MIKVTIQSVINADYFKIKKYPAEFFDSKPKAFELVRGSADNSDNEKITVSAKNVNSGENLFTITPVEEIEVDGVVYTSYEDLSEVLTPLLFKKGGGTGGGGTISDIIPVFIPVTMSDIQSNEFDTQEERNQKIATWIEEQGYDRPGGELWFWDIIDEPGSSGGSGSDSLWSQTEDGEFRIEDENGNVGFRLTNDGLLDIVKFTDGTKEAITTFVSEELPTVETSGVVVQPSLDNYADINHILTYGQSLSVGQTEVVITTSALFPNLVNFDGVTRTSPNDKSLTGDTYPTNRRLALVPITERVNDGATATGTLRETPTSGTLESLALEINKFSSTTFPTLPMKLLGSAPGWGAMTVAQLSKGTAYYTQLIADVTAGKTLANNTDKLYKVLAVTWTQGESDYVSSTSSVDYKSRLIQLKNDLNSDIKAITGQTEDVAFVMYQTATSNGGSKTYPNIALVQYDLAMNNPGFYMATAMYQFKYNDGFHLKSESSKLLGAYYGLAINKIISEKKNLKPLHPKSYLVQGNLCKLKFEVPKAPLKFQAANTITLTNKGFAVIKGGVDILTSVTLGDDGVSVNLKCSASPLGGLIQYGINVTLTPGGTSNSKVNMGNLSDSQGDTQKFNIGGTDLAMDNWSPIFEYQI